VLHPVDQLSLGFGGEYHLAVDARRQTTGVALGHPPHAHERVSAGPEHQLLPVQAGVAVRVSPVLLNVALHGMETAAGVSYNAHGWTRPDSPVLIRYADDMVALCHSRQQAEQIKARLTAWLTPRGLI
jgi:hypothetical protein